MPAARSAAAADLPDALEGEDSRITFMTRVDSIVVLREQ
jgi:hypothetical protein